MFPPDSSEFRKFWTEDRIDRSFAVNSHRLMIGLAVADSWDRIDGSLVVGQGRGKFLRLRHASDLGWPIPDELSARLVQASQNPEPSHPSLLQLGQDLADCQAQLVARLSGEAGKYVDRILGVTLTDPGFWSSDFDGTRLYSGAPDPARLAELSGMNVIDDLPQRDIAAGGDGSSLQALPMWFLFADRQTRGATGVSLVIDFSDVIRCYLLPPSDGLDEILPDICCETVAGSADPEVPVSKTIHRMLRDFSTRGGESIPFPILSHLVLTGKPDQPLAGKRLLERLAGDFPTATVEEWFAHPDGSPLAGRMAAILGLLYVDQLPQNVPGLTGASGLRILGRLTPGKPFSWRNLLTAMADSQSAPMRLRDAV